MSDKKTMRLTLKVWRQNGPQDSGHFETYELDNVNPDWSFLEMLDILNMKLVREGKEPIAFESDCREGICGTCGFVINGRAHGKLHRTTVCQLHMRHFKDGETIVIEPFRATAFPVLKDLIIDRSAMDFILKRGGYISVNVGSAPDANTIPVPKSNADKAFDFATCIGCGACVAACPNASAALFVSAKITHLALLPQGHPERERRVEEMLTAMEEQGFGGCSNTYACEVECPKGISITGIARANLEYWRAKLKGN